VVRAKLLQLRHRTGRMPRAFMARSTLYARLSARRMAAKTFLRFCGFEPPTQRLIEISPRPLGMARSPIEPANSGRVAHGRLIPGSVTLEQERLPDAPKAHCPIELCRQLRLAVGHRVTRAVHTILEPARRELLPRE